MFIQFNCSFHYVDNSFEMFHHFCLLLLTFPKCCKVFSEWKRLDRMIFFVNFTRKIPIECRCPELRSLLCTFENPAKCIKISLVPKVFLRHSNMLITKPNEHPGLVHFDQMHQENGCISSHYEFHGLLCNANRRKMTFAIALIVQKMN